jgi:hypothetical protein
MTPAQIKKAQELLDKRKELLTLKDRYGREVGEIRYEFNNQHQKQPVFIIEEFRIFSLDTMERWVKQAKTAQKKNIL